LILPALFLIFRNPLGCRLGARLVVSAAAFIFELLLLYEFSQVEMRDAREQPHDPDGRRAIDDGRSAIVLEV
jgi:hypothetical protein